MKFLPSKDFGTLGVSLKKGPRECDTSKAFGFSMGSGPQVALRENLRGREANAFGLSMTPDPKFLYEQRHEFKQLTGCSRGAKAL